ncbi:hypothetical protein [Chryseobacterium sp. YIM B08800]|uniref:hypothetical protein n=1 Tax=Chryseobacterium sp. YIM B08800 TaxID=2984136 RepID=UPI0022402D22|nr:hypothetical protein [Chryseobacterium sp. YIM B08800]
MKRVNSRQYKILVGFCKKVFKDRKYISQKNFGLLMQQELTQMTCRYRRNMLSLQLIKEKNQLITPGIMLTHFKLQDYQAITRLQKTGKLWIIDKKIKYQPNNPKTELQLPDHWIIESKYRGILIFNVKSNEKYEETKV